ncbi:MAG: MlaD family protein [Acidobacteriota bacterium]|nr:MlaD family protein [Acidobacteriota bacterium]
MAVRSALQQLSVGLVVLLSLVIFAGTILIIGQETRLFVAKNTYRTNFTDASGLRVGSPVTMAGVRVGTINRIVLPTDPSSEGIEVFVTVDRDFAVRVREGTEARVVYLQIVANEKAVDLTPGNPDGEPLQDGAFIPPAELDEFLETGRTIADTLEEVTSDLKDILGAISRGEGLLGKAIVDPSFGEEGLEKIDAALTALSSVLQRIDDGEGLIGKAITDEEFARELSADLTEAVGGLARIVDRLDRGEGLLGQLTVGDESDRLLDDARAASASFREVAEGMERGDGLAGMLLRDEQLGRRIAGNLEELTERLASIAGKIDEGQGTLGQLVNERTLHDDVEQLLAGVRDSKLLSWLIRRYHRKGEAPVARQ